MHPAKCGTKVYCKDGKYWPARPYQDAYRFERFKAAWAVFTKKADAFVWPEQEIGTSDGGPLPEGVQPHFFSGLKYSAHNDLIHSEMTRLENL